MADIKGVADKAEKKHSRRSSLLAVAKRVKQFEHGKGDKRQDILNDEFANRSSSPKPPSTPAKDHLLDDGTRAQDYSGGAEIPDIPMRRNKRATERADLGLDTLAALERILTAGSPQRSQSPQLEGPQNDSLSPHKGRTDKRYDDHGVDLDQDFKGEGRLLYPVSECSTEWESNSLDDVPEGDDTPNSLKRESISSANFNTPLSPRVVAPISSDHSVDISLAPRGTATFQPGLQPKLITPSLTTAGTSHTDMSVQTAEPTIPTLPALQAKGIDDLEDGLQPVDEENMEPGSFDLIVPSRLVGVYSLERRSELLFSTEHLRVIFADPIFLNRFSAFVATYRPLSSMALLNYALDAVKAIRAMDWMNAIISKNLRLEGGKPQHSFFMGPLPELTANESLRRKAAAAMDALARDELPAYVTHVWTDIVEVSMKRKITGSMPAHLREMSEGLAEVFCLSDPSRPDNPIVFASEEFHRTTQYGPDYVLGRNCRFLQGPKTNPYAVQRIREMVKLGKEHYETFLNYRRDGLPFMNLLMTTPLFDSRGQVRYYLGAQVDVSGLVKDCSGLESLRRLVDRDEEDQFNGEIGEHRQRRDSGTNFDNIPGGVIPVGTATTTLDARAAPNNDEVIKDEFRLLAEMFNRTELDTVRRFGGRMHRSQQEQIQHVEAVNAANWQKPRVVLHDSSPPISPPISPPVNTGNPSQQQQQQQQGTLTATDANGNISVNAARPRSPLGAHSTSSPQMSNHSSRHNESANKNIPRAPAIFENYLVVRPYPSLRILFASRPMRVPGILQSHLMSRIGGSRRIHDELEQAFAAGQSVTAKIKWISGSDLRNANAAQQNNHGIYGNGNGGNNSNDQDSNASTTSLHNGRGSAAGNYPLQHHGNSSNKRHETVGMDGRPRWIHCTPLTSTAGTVGVWVVVIVDEENEATERAARRRQDFSTGGLGINNNSNSDGASPYSAGTPTGERRQQRQQRRPRDEMSLTDFATMNRLPEDEDLRQHFREMYEDARRRERGVVAREGVDKAWGMETGTAVARPGSRTGTRGRFDGSGRSLTPDMMSYR